MNQHIGINLFNIKQKRIINNNTIVVCSCFLVISISLLLRLLCIGYNDLLVEEAYYWNYAKHLDIGYLDHPPMVAVLIKLSTSIFGSNEFGVRITSLFCWLLTAYFSCKLTNLIVRDAGQYAVMLLAVLPFFFLHSLVITPDQPLTACWSAALYYLYCSLILNKSNCWYAAGFWLGLGMLSKYTIVLLGFATFLYVCLIPTARVWLTRKEPYLCILIIVLIFTPVLYWNITHDWVSFIFQGSRRFKAAFSFSFHYFIGLLIFFLMPLGVWGLWKLSKKNILDSLGITNSEISPKYFLQLFTWVPLIFFGFFSINHAIRFNWIGPVFLAVIPWLAILIVKTPKTNRFTIREGWFVTSVILLVCYSCMMFGITFGTPEIAHKTLFKKFIAWDDLAQQFNQLAKQIELKTNKVPILAPLDLYNISSELSFYQEKLLRQGEIQKSYPIIERHIFGGESLMYRYWSKNEVLSGKILILISTEPRYFNNLNINRQIKHSSSVKIIWAHSQGQGTQVKPYYYKVIQIKS